jgi:hypothetical protein
MLDFVQQLKLHLLHLQLREADLHRLVGVGRLRVRVVVNFPQGRFNAIRQIANRTLSRRERDIMIKFMRSGLSIVITTLIVLAPLSGLAAAANDTESYTYKLTQSTASTI